MSTQKTPLGKIDQTYRIVSKTNEQKPKYTQLTIHFHS